MTPVIKLTPSQTDRACGVLLGSACGDALGAGYEFGCAPLVGEPAMIGGGLGGFAPGEWTDDTSQAYAIARVAATGVDIGLAAGLDPIAAGLAEWFSSHPPDVGNQTRQVLLSVEGGAAAPAMTAAAQSLHERTGRTAGNGSLMRTGPVALAYLADEDGLIRAARAISSLTHADPLAGDACVLWSLAIRSTVLTGDLTGPGEGLDALPAERRSFWAETINQAETKGPAEFRPNGYVITAFQAAWSAITHTPTPADDPSRGSFPGQHLVHALETAISVGDDTDTVAAIAGALLGARWGASAVPSAWRRMLHGRPGGAATDLTRLATLTVRGGQPDRDGWPGVARLAYAGWSGDNLAIDPHDSGVYLGGVAGLDRLPSDVTAVISLCRVGDVQVPAGLHHLDFRLIDTDAADNPNLAYAIDDAARTVMTLRNAGEVVFLHCVAGQSRTPTVAARYAALRGYPSEQALTDVCRVLTGANPNRAMRATLAALDPPLFDDTGGAHTPG